MLKPVANAITVSKFRFLKKPVRFINKLKFGFKNVLAFTEIVAYDCYSINRTSIIYHIVFLSFGPNLASHTKKD